MSIYSCWTDDPSKPRGRPSHDMAQDGWTEDGRRIMRAVESTWAEMRCGHNLRVTDPGCTGCANRSE